MHANRFWWAWPFQFRRLCPFFICLQNGQNSISGHELQSMGLKNRISSKNSFKQRLQICHAKFLFWAIDYSLWNILQEQYIFTKYMYSIHTVQCYPVYIYEPTCITNVIDNQNMNINWLLVFFYQPAPPIPLH